MAGNLLGIGKSGLYAAQAALSTAGHNITNANVAGYSRQVVVQSTSLPHEYGYGFVGSGTQITDIKRYSDNFLNTQVRNAQSSKSALDSYYAQISQIDNVLADTTSGLSPSLQNFFAGVQDLAAAPSSVPARQSFLSNAETLATRFHDLDGRLQEVRDGVNARISTNIGLINSYASEIAGLNEQIAKYSAGLNRKPNDLLDARDQMVADLNKLIKANVMPGDNDSLTVTVGAGMPLVVGSRPFELVATTSPTDQARVEVGFMTGSKLTVMPENSLSGGELGGLLDFRANTLDRAQNSLGRIAIGMAAAFNAQHKLGIDSDGALGGDLFTIPPAVVGRARTNDENSTAAVSASVVDINAMTRSDYKVEFETGSYWVRRTADDTLTEINPYPQVTGPQVVDGIAFAITGTAAEGDYFQVRPSIAGAALFDVALTDAAKIAAASPLITSTSLENAGSARLNPAEVDTDFLQPGNAQGILPLTFTYDTAVPAQVSGFPVGQVVTLTDAAGVATDYTAGTDPIPFQPGTRYTFGGVTISFTGQPAHGDSFTVGPNGGGVRDSSNARLMGELQTKLVLDGGRASFQSGYAELVSFIGNKTREVQVNGDAGQALLDQARGAQQDVSGVNLDEEAANLLKYQQAYQAAGKVMQIASEMFDTLLSLR